MYHDAIADGQPPSVATCFTNAITSINFARWAAMTQLNRNSITLQTLEQCGG